jgi:hypothetical protein
VAIVDSEGRVFGRLNVFDAAAVAVLVAMVALTVAGYRLFRLPVPPRIEAVTPAGLTSGSDLRVTIKGEGLLPYWRAYVQRAAESPGVSLDAGAMTRTDNYALVNGVQAKFLVESQTLAEVRLPDGLLPGTYDLILNNEANIVAVRRLAFTVSEARTHVTTATVPVRFVARPDVIALVREQDVDVSPPAEGEGAAKIVSIQRRSEMTGEFTENLTDGTIRGTQRVGVLECVLQMPVMKTPTGWTYRAQAIKAGAGITFQTDGYVVRGTIARPPTLEDVPAKGGQ